MVVNSKKIILDLCGGTGAWSKPYKDAGYDVRLITLPEVDVTETEFGIDKHIYFNPPHGSGHMDGINPKNVYGILVAPPCTMFSIARRTAKTPPDFIGAMQVVKACLDIVWHCRIQGGLKFWALENPRGLLRQFIGIPRHTFYQWQFGGQHKKPSDIWGYYNPPTPTVSTEPNFDVDKSWQKPIAPDGYRHLKLSRAAIRAITPSGFANAFFKANQ